MYHNISSLRKVTQLSNKALIVWLVERRLADCAGIRGGATPAKLNAPIDQHV
jgi:hypothetical protein